MTLSAELQSISPLAQIARNADHLDVKTYDGDVSMAQFIAGFMNFYPGWMKALYRVRWFFVRLLGMTQDGIPPAPNMRPEDVPMQPGKHAAFFKVEAAELERYWLVSADEPHLAAYLCIAAQPITDNRRRFSVVTIVHYHKWTGKVYFNVIRPFHHVVVNSMARGGLRFPV